MSNFCKALSIICVFVSTVSICVGQENLSVEVTADQNEIIWGEELNYFVDAIGGIPRHSVGSTVTCADQFAGHIFLLTTPVGLTSLAQTHKGVDVGDFTAHGRATDGAGGDVTSFLDFTVKSPTEIRLQQNVWTMNINFVQGRAKGSVDVIFEVLSDGQLVGECALGLGQEQITRRRNGVQTVSKWGPGSPDPRFYFDAPFIHDIKTLNFAEQDWRDLPPGHILDVLKQQVRVQYNECGQIAPRILESPLYDLIWQKIDDDTLLISFQ